LTVVIFAMFRSIEFASDLSKVSLHFNQTKYSDRSREWTQLFIKTGTYTNQTGNLFLMGCEMTSYHFKLGEQKLFYLNHSYEQLQ